MRASIYARYSTDRQSESSIADQVRVCHDYARRHGLEVCATFTDLGISGAALGNRPGARALEAAALRGEFAVILVVDLTRLSRSVGDLSKMLERLRFRGLRVVGVQDGYDSASRTARMQAGLSGIMSEELRASIRDRTHSALEGRARARKPTGGRAYGYGPDGLPAEPEATVALEVFTRFAAGESMRSIASDLNARGVPSPGAGWQRKRRRTDAVWLVSALHAILHNERYTGRVVWNRSEWRKDPDSGRRVRRERPRSEWVEHRDPAAAIVPEGVWRRAAARFSRRGPGRGGALRYLLSGLLVCGLCGARFVVYGGRQHRYVCGTFHAGGPAACSNRVTVPRPLVEELILEPVVRELLSPAAVELGVAEIRRLAAEAAAPVDPGPELAAVERELEELARLMSVGTLSEGTAGPAVRAAEERRRAILRASERRGVREALVAVEEAAAAYRAAALELRTVLDSSDRAAAREPLAELIGDVRLVPRDGVLVAHFTRGTVALTGSGSWVGSGGPLLTHLPDAIELKPRGGSSSHRRIAGPS
jgi:site-specific DNA recombinase